MRKEAKMTVTVWFIYIYIFIPQVYVMKIYRIHNELAKGL